MAGPTKIGQWRRGAKRGIARAARYLLTQTVGAVIGALVALGVAWIIGAFHHSPEPIDVQLEDVLAQAARQHFRVVYNDQVDLKGTGNKARVLVFRGPYDSSGYPKGSDRLQVYEQHGNRLALALTVRPLFRPRSGIPFQFRWRATGQFDDTAEQEVIFGLDPQYADTEVPHPVALTWDVQQSAYVLRPLLPQPVAFPPADPGTFTWAAHRAYQPVDIPLEGGGTLRGVGGTQAFAIARSRLAAAYIFRRKCNGCGGGTYAIRTFDLDFQGASSPSRQCTPTRYYGRPAPPPEVLSIESASAMTSVLDAALGRPDLVCLPPGTS